MDEYGGIESLSRDFRGFQDALRKARRDSRFLEEAMSRCLTLNPDLEQEKQNLYAQIEWLESTLEYMRRRLRNAEKRANEDKNSR